MSNITLKFFNILVRIVIATIILIAVETVTNLIVGLGSSFLMDWWQTLLSRILVVSVLTGIVLQSKLKNHHLIIAIFTLIFVISHLLTLIEAIAFGFDVPKWQLFISGVLSSAIFSFLLVFIFKKMNKTNILSGGFNNLPFISIIWRIGVLALIYMVIYTIAGMIILPFVKDFYATLTIPGLSILLPLQILRGALYVVACLYLILNAKGSRIEKAIWIGLAFSILGGIAPLLLPNPIMPLEIRIAHGFEVGISNFIFGVIVVFIFTSKSFRTQ